MVQKECTAQTTAGTELEGAVTVDAGIQSWTVPSTGTYYIGAYGAQGASGTAASDEVFAGGLGAYACGGFDLVEGQVIQIAVGQQGIADIPDATSAEANSGGGGGGSFVVTSDDEPLLIAGGGGGTRVDALDNGCDGVTHEYGTMSTNTAGYSSSWLDSEPCPTRTDEPGYGGGFSDSWGAGGGGFYGAGADDDGSWDLYGYGGGSWADGVIGGEAVYVVYFAHGGFGGGGSGEGGHGGGGGGGYSGGDGGWIAGGGGSFNSGSDATATAGANEGHGWVHVNTEGCADGEVMTVKSDGSEELP